MRIILFFGMILILHIPSTVIGQYSINPDVNKEYAALKDSKIRNLLIASDRYYFLKPDSSFYYANIAIREAKAAGLQLEEVIALNVAGEGYRFLGDFPSSLDVHFRAIEICRAKRFQNREAFSLGFIGITYLDLKEFNTALHYLFEAKSRYEKLKTPARSFEYFNLSNISEGYAGVNKLDSALIYARTAFNASLKYNHPILTILCERRLAAIQYRLGQVDSALNSYQHALYLISKDKYDEINFSTIKNELAEIYLSLHNPDSSLLFAKQAFSHALRIGQIPEILNSAKLLGVIMQEKGVLDSALYYNDQAFQYQDRIYGPESLRHVNLIALREQRKQQDSLQEQYALQARFRQLMLLLSLIFILLLAVFLYRRALQRKKANAILEEKNKRINDTLKSLRETQAQLIQQEKMASLGELTAGIAHEIQNPLNFVNNFSEVNKELMQELTQEIDKGNYAEIRKIAIDVVINEEKINEHGRRADSIVKSMLQHSRVSSGKKELTDINALADEYLRISFHGMRARDKSFHATLQTDFDKTIENIAVIPQDIGRVLLNLYNNAFYSLSEKAKLNQKAYEPKISVTSKKIDSKVIITVSDNGVGIPEKIKDKIFQPFFTTKPAGQGTGLGLSLSYDIIKAHNGEIKVETTESEGSVFIILLSNA